MIRDSWVPLRTLGMFTRRSGDSMLLESYTDAYEMNATGAFIWSQTGGSGTVAEIVAAVVDRYGIDPASAVKAVHEFFEQLVERGFLQPDPDAKCDDPR